MKIHTLIFFVETQRNQVGGSYVSVKHPVPIFMYEYTPTRLRAVIIQRLQHELILRVLFASIRHDNVMSW
jgi:hypothetical protein